MHIAIAGDPHPTFRRLFAVNAFNGPAPKKVDAKLFANASPSIVKLQKEARAGLRDQAREEYWTQKQVLEQQQALAQSQGTAAVQTQQQAQAQQMQEQEGFNG